MVCHCMLLAQFLSCEREGARHVHLAHSSCSLVVRMMPCGNVLQGMLDNLHLTFHILRARHQSVHLEDHVMKHT